MVKRRQREAKPLEPGMTFREYAAVAAMQALLQGGFRTVGQSAAFAAVQAADALIHELNQPRPQAAETTKGSNDAATLDG